MSWPQRSGGSARGLILIVVGLTGLLILGLLTAPLMLFASGSLLRQSASACAAAQGGGAAQPMASSGARNSIPADYLALFQATGAKDGIPWVILAAIGKVESDDGRSSLPGVRSGANAYGAAGPMQIGIGGAAGNTWGGAPAHPASEQVSGVATDANGDGVASVYEPADAIAGAAKYLLAHGALDNVSGAIFAYNHLQSYVQAVLKWAAAYSAAGYTVSPVTLDSAPSCLTGTSQVPNARVAAAIAYAEAQLGKPYLWGGTGPDAFDCSGLVMEAYLAAGIAVPRTSQQQWLWGPRVSPGQAEPGDLVFFAGSDGTVTAPGHVGLVIGGGKMLEAYATGYPIRIAPYAGGNPVGFTRPWAHTGSSVAGLASGPAG